MTDKKNQQLFAAVCMTTGQAFLSIADWLEYQVELLRARARNGTAVRVPARDRCDGGAYDTPGRIAESLENLARMSPIGNDDGDNRDGRKKTEYGDNVISHDKFSQ